MPDAPVIVAARAFKDALLKREHDQMLQLTRLWLQLFEPLESEVELVAQYFAQRVADGDTPTRGALYRLDRYQSILGQVQARTAAFNGAAVPLIASGQREFAGMAIDFASEAIQAAATFRVAFERLPIEHVEAMFGLAGDGSPLAAVLEKNFEAMAPRFAEKLVTGTAFGWNPRKTAQAAAKELQIPLQQAMVTTRTEQMRVGRETTRAAYQESGVVAGQMRLSARDLRVCPACLMADGEILPLGTPLPEHPQGRCTVIPVLIDEEPPGHEKGRDWFLRQTPAAQEEILGDNRFDAWRAGRFDLADLAVRKTDPDWGETLQTAPLSELAPGWQRRARRPKNKPAGGRS